MTDKPADLAQAVTDALLRSAAEQLPAQIDAGTLLQIRDTLAALPSPENPAGPLALLTGPVAASHGATEVLVTVWPDGSGEYAYRVHAGGSWGIPHPLTAAPLMGEPMTDAQEAAAMWGSAENLHYTAENRLACALRALTFYGAAYEDAVEQLAQHAPPPPPDLEVIGLRDCTDGDCQDCSPLWGRVVGQTDEWKGYKNGGKVYLSWAELSRRWGPLTVDSRRP